MKNHSWKKITSEKNHSWINHSWINHSWLNHSWLNHSWINHSWINHSLINHSWTFSWETCKKVIHLKITRSLRSLVEFLKINIFLHFRVVYHWFTFARVTFTSWSIMPPSSNQVSFCWALPVYYGYVGNNLTCQDLSELQFWYLLPSSSFVPFWSWCRFMLNLWSLEWDFWLLFWVFLFT